MAKTPKKGSPPEQGNESKSQEPESNVPRKPDASSSSAAENRLKREESTGRILDQHLVSESTLSKKPDEEKQQVPKKQENVSHRRVDELKQGFEHTDAALDAKEEDRIKTDIHKKSITPKIDDASSTKENAALNALDDLQKLLSGYVQLDDTVRKNVATLHVFCSLHHNDANQTYKSNLRDDILLSPGFNDERDEKGNLKVAKEINEKMALLKDTPYVDIAKEMIADAQNKIGIIMAANEEKGKIIKYKKPNREELEDTETKKQIAARTDFNTTSRAIVEKCKQEVAQKGKYKPDETPSSEPMAKPPKQPPEEQKNEYQQEAQTAIREISEGTITEKGLSSIFDQASALAKRTITKDEAETVKRAVKFLKDENEAFEKLPDDIKSELQRLEGPIHIVQKAIESGDPEKVAEALTQLKLGIALLKDLRPALRSIDAIINMPYQNYSSKLLEGLEVTPDSIKGNIQTLKESRNYLFAFISWLLDPKEFAKFNAHMIKDFTKEFATPIRDEAQKIIETLYEATKSIQKKLLDQCDQIHDVDLKSEISKLESDIPPEKSLLEKKAIFIFNFSKGNFEQKLNEAQKPKESKEEKDALPKPVPSGDPNITKTESKSDTPEDKKQPTDKRGEENISPIDKILAAIEKCDDPDLLKRILNADTQEKMIEELSTLIGKNNPTDKAILADLITENALNGRGGILATAGKQFFNLILKDAAEEEKSLLQQHENCKNLLEIIDNATDPRRTRTSALELYGIKNLAVIDYVIPPSQASQAKMALGNAAGDGIRHRFLLRSPNDYIKDFDTAKTIANMPNATVDKMVDALQEEPFNFNVSQAKSIVRTPEHVSQIITGAQKLALIYSLNATLTTIEEAEKKADGIVDATEDSSLLKEKIEKLRDAIDKPQADLTALTAQVNNLATEADAFKSMVEERYVSWMTIRENAATIQKQSQIINESLTDPRNNFEAKIDEPALPALETDNAGLIRHIDQQNQLLTALNALETDIIPTASRLKNQLSKPPEALEKLPPNIKTIFLAESERIKKEINKIVEDVTVNFDTEGAKEKLEKLETDLNTLNNKIELEARRLQTISQIREKIDNSFAEQKGDDANPTMHPYVRDELNKLSDKLAQLENPSQDDLEKIEDKVKLLLEKDPLLQRLEAARKILKLTNIDKTKILGMIDTLETQTKVIENINELPREDIIKNIEKNVNDFVLEAIKNAIKDCNDYEILRQILNATDDAHAIEKLCVLLKIDNAEDIQTLTKLITHEVLIADNGILATAGAQLFKFICDDAAGEMKTTEFNVHKSYDGLSGIMHITHDPVDEPIKFARRFATQAYEITPSAALYVMPDGEDQEDTTLLTWGNAAGEGIRKSFIQTMDLKTASLFAELDPENTKLVNIHSIFNQQLEFSLSKAASIVKNNTHVKEIILAAKQIVLHENIQNLKAQIKFIVEDHPGEAKEEIPATMEALIAIREKLKDDMPAIEFNEQYQLFLTAIKNEYDRINKKISINDNTALTYRASANTTPPYPNNHFEQSRIKADEAFSIKPTPPEPLSASSLIDNLGRLKTQNAALIEAELHYQRGLLQQQLDEAKVRLEKSQEHSAYNHHLATIKSLEKLIVDANIDRLSNIKKGIPVLINTINNLPLSQESKDTLIKTIIENTKKIKDTLQECKYNDLDHQPTIKQFNSLESPENESIPILGQHILSQNSYLAKLEQLRIFIEQANTLKDEIKTTRGKITELQLPSARDKQDELTRIERQIDQIVAHAAKELEIGADPLKSPREKLQKLNYELAILESIRNAPDEDHNFEALMEILEAATESKNEQLEKGITCPLLNQRLKTTQGKLISWKPALKEQKDDRDTIIKELFPDKVADSGDVELFRSRVDGVRDTTRKQIAETFIPDRIRNRNLAFEELREILNASNEKELQTAVSNPKIGVSLEQAKLLIPESKTDAPDKIQNAAAVALRPQIIDDVKKLNDFELAKKLAVCPDVAEMKKILKRYYSSYDSTDRSVDLLIPNNAAGETFVNQIRKAAQEKCRELLLQQVDGLKNLDIAKKLADVEAKDADGKGMQAALDEVQWFENGKSSSVVDDHVSTQIREKAGDKILETLPALVATLNIEQARKLAECKGDDVKSMQELLVATGPPINLTANQAVSTIRDAGHANALRAEARKRELLLILDEAEKIIRDAKANEGKVSVNINPSIQNIEELRTQINTPNANLDTLTPEVNKSLTAANDFKADLERRQALWVQIDKRSADIQRLSDNINASLGKPPLDEIKAELQEFKSPDGKASVLALENNLTSQKTHITGLQQFKIVITQADVLKRKLHDIDTKLPPGSIIKRDLQAIRDNIDGIVRETARDLSKAADAKQRLQEQIEALDRLDPRIKDEERKMATPEENLNRTLDAIYHASQAKVTRLIEVEEKSTSWTDYGKARDIMAAMHQDPHSEIFDPNEVRRAPATAGNIPKPNTEKRYINSNTTFSGNGSQIRAAIRLRELELDVLHIIDDLALGRKPTTPAIAAALKKVSLGTFGREDLEALGVPIVYFANWEKYICGSVDANSLKFTPEQKARITARAASKYAALKMSFAEVTEEKLDLVSIEKAIADPTTIATARTDLFNLGGAIYQRNNPRAAPPHPDEKDKALALHLTEAELNALTAEDLPIILAKMKGADAAITIGFDGVTVKNEETLLNNAITNATARDLKKTKEWLLALSETIYRKNHPSFAGAVIDAKDSLPELHINEDQFNALTVEDLPRIEAKMRRAKTVLQFKFTDIPDDKPAYVTALDDAIFAVNAARNPGDLVNAMNTLLAAMPGLAPYTALGFRTNGDFETARDNLRIEDRLLLLAKMTSARAALGVTFARVPEDKATELKAVFWTGAGPGAAAIPAQTRAALEILIDTYHLDIGITTPQLATINDADLAPIVAKAKSRSAALSAHFENVLIPGDKLLLDAAITTITTLPLNIGNIQRELTALAAGSGHPAVAIDIGMDADQIAALTVADLDVVTTKMKSRSAALSAHFENVLIPGDKLLLDAAITTITTLPLNIGNIQRELSRLADGSGAGIIDIGLTAQQIMDLTIADCPLVAAKMKSRSVALDLKFGDVLEEKSLAVIASLGNITDIAAAKTYLQQIRDVHGIDIGIPAGPPDKIGDLRAEDFLLVQGKTKSLENALRLNFDNLPVGQYGNVTDRLRDIKNLPGLDPAADLATAKDKLKELIAVGIGMDIGLPDDPTIETLQVQDLKRIQNKAAGALVFHHTQQQIASAKPMGHADFDNADEVAKRTAIDALAIPLPPATPPAHFVVLMKDALNTHGAKLLIGAGLADGIPHLSLTQLTSIRNDAAAKQIEVKGPTYLREQCDKFIIQAEALRTFIGDDSVTPHAQGFYAKLKTDIIDDLNTVLQPVPPIGPPNTKSIIDKLRDNEPLTIPERDIAVKVVKKIETGNYFELKAPSYTYANPDGTPPPTQAQKLCNLYKMMYEEIKEHLHKAAEGDAAAFAALAETIEKMKLLIIEMRALAGDAARFARASEMGPPPAPPGRPPRDKFLEILHEYEKLTFAMDQQVKKGFQHDRPMDDLEQYKTEGEYQTWLKATTNTSKNTGATLKLRSGSSPQKFDKDTKYTVHPPLLANGDRDIKKSAISETKTPKSFEFTVHDLPWSMGTRKEEVFISDRGLLYKFLQEQFADMLGNPKLNSTELKNFILGELPPVLTKDDVVEFMNNHQALGINLGFFGKNAEKLANEFIDSYLDKERQNAAPTGVFKDVLLPNPQMFACARDYIDKLRERGDRGDIQLPVTYTEGSNKQLIIAIKLVLYKDGLNNVITFPRKKPTPEPTPDQYAAMKDNAIKLDDKVFGSKYGTIKGSEVAQTKHDVDENLGKLTESTHKSGYRPEWQFLRPPKTHDPDEAAGKIETTVQNPPPYTRKK